MMMEVTRIGLVVADLKKAIRFFSTFFDCEQTSEIGIEEGSWLMNVAMRVQADFHLDLFESPEKPITSITLDVPYPRILFSQIVSYAKKERLECETGQSEYGAPWLVIPSIFKFRIYFLEKEKKPSWPRGILKKLRLVK